MDSLLTVILVKDPPAGAPVFILIILYYFCQGGYVIAVVGLPACLSVSKAFQKVKIIMIFS